MPTVPVSTYTVHNDGSVSYLAPARVALSPEALREQLGEALDVLRALNQEVSGEALVPCRVIHVFNEPRGEH